MGPCQGITVLDLSRYLPGRFCTLMLAYTGAEVITVEPPRVPSAKIRPIGKDTGARYIALNRNKKSITVDLHSEDGKEIFYKLVKKAAVIVESSRPGVAKRLGIDYPAARRINPKIVYASISNFGQDGPYANLPGHDITCLGLAGLLDVKEFPPVLPGILLSDTIAACMATIGILSALLEAQKSGKGQYVDLSILDAVISCLNVRAMRHFLDTTPAPGEDDFTYLIYPFYNVYKAKDNRYITVAAVEPHFWKRLCVMLGREDFVQYQFDKGTKRAEIFEHFRKTFAARNSDEWVRRLRCSDIPGGPVNTLEEVFQDPQVIHRNMVADMPHPLLGAVKYLGIPMKFSETPGEFKSPPPLYGEHTVEILESSGYSKEAIEVLQQKGVVERAPEIFTKK